MEINSEILQWIFITVFIVASTTLFRVKHLLKKKYPEKHNEIFGKSLLEYSPGNSIKIMRLALFKRNWEFFQDAKLLAWLRFLRVVTLTFNSIIFLGVMYLVVMVVIELMKA